MLNHVSRMIKRLAGSACVLAFVACVGASSAQAATNLYPDLRTLPPRDLRLASADVTGTDGGGTGIHNVLRFSNTVWNAGQGPVVVRGAIDPATKAGPGFQRIYDSAGNFTEEPAGSFKWHGGNHNHFHYENWGHYQLWTAAKYDAWIAGGRQNAMIEDTGSKTTSCVLDEEFVSNVPGTRAAQDYGFNGCLAQNVDGNDLLEGMSVGWGDTYDYWRDDQWIDLGPGGHLADGNYVLRSVTDPDNQIYESPDKADASRESEENNDAIRRFTIANGQIVDSDAPTGSVAVDSLTPSTNDPHVTVHVVGRDDVSGVDSFRISNNGTNWSSPYRYATDDNPNTALTTGSTLVERDWNLADAATGGNAITGTHTVYVQFHDASGKWGPAATETIHLDGSAPPSRYSNAIRADSPAALWRLNDQSGTTMVDDIGAHNGTYLGSPTLKAPGLLGSEPDNDAVAFDGQNDAGRVPDSGTLDLTNNFTLEAWIKPDTLPGPGGFVSVLSKPEAYSLQFYGSQLEFTVIAGDDNGDRGRHRVRTPIGMIQAGRAYHIAGTYDGTTQRLYVDGALVASQALNLPASVNANPVSVGSWDGGQEFFDGTIDEAAIYPSALTATRLNAHIAAGDPDPQPPAAPTALAATQLGANSIKLTWTDNATTESAYSLQRSTDSTFASGVTSIDIGQDQTTWTDTGLDPNQTYYYRLRARNPIGYSSFSSTASGHDRRGRPGRLHRQRDAVQLRRDAERHGRPARLRCQILVRVRAVERELPEPQAARRLRDQRRLRPQRRRGIGVADRPGLRDDLPLSDRRLERRRHDAGHRCELHDVGRARSVGPRRHRGDDLGRAHVGRQLERRDRLRAAAQHELRLLGGRHELHAAGRLDGLHGHRA